MRAAALCLAFAGCAFTFQERPDRAAKCSTGRGLAAVDGLAAVASFSVVAAAISDDGIPHRTVMIPVAAAFATAFGASALIGRGWSDRCRQSGFNAP